MRVSDLVPWRGRTLSRRGQDSVYDMREEMNRLFEEFFQEFGPAKDGGELAAFNPSMNLTESDEVIEATVELPGMDEGDIDVSLGPEGLTIKGEKQVESEEDGKSYFRRERSYGYFERTVPLPMEAVDRDNVEASFEKGILRVTIPKQEPQKETRRQIEVRSE